MPDTALSHLSQFNLKIDGAQASRDLMFDLLDCTVENSLTLPDMCAIRMHDAEFRWQNLDAFAIGKRIQVLAGEENTPTLLPIFDGEVTSIDMDMAAHGTPTLLIRAYDRSHRLSRGRFQKTFQNMKDSDIVQQVGSAAGFTVHADATSQVHDWILQNNQTNWEFLNERASYNGFRLYVQGEKDLYFKKVKDESSDAIPLKYGISLRSFRPRITASPQVSEVQVKGWDPKTKKPILGTSSSANGLPKVGYSGTGVNTGQSKFGGAAKMVVVDRPVHSQKEAEDLARSILDDIAGSYLEAEGLAYGNPKILPGSVVKVEDVGDKFSGKYHISSTTHVYTPSEGYTTLFSINGKRPSTLLGILDEEGSGSRTDLGGNIVVALVTNNKDEKNLGRIKVKYPWLTSEHESDWIRIAAPMAGGGRGFNYLPEVDDEVLVAFEHGDPRRAYMIGALWNGTDKPPYASDKAVEGGKVVRHVTRSRLGHQMMFKDTEDGGGIGLKTKYGHVVQMNDKDKIIKLETKDGHKVTIDDPHATIVIVDKTGNNKITIKSNDNSVTIDCAGNMSINAGGKFSVEAKAGIEMHSPAPVKIAADSNINVEAKAQLGLKGQAMAQLESPMTTVKGDGILTVQGGLVKIN